MSDKSATARTESRRTKVDKVVFHGSGAAILGNNPGIRTKAEANRVIETMLGRRYPAKP